MSTPSDPGQADSSNTESWQGYQPEGSQGESAGQAAAGGQNPQYPSSDQYPTQQQYPGTPEGQQYGGQGYPAPQQYGAQGYPAPQQYGTQSYPAPQQPAAQQPYTSPAYGQEPQYAPPVAYPAGGVDETAYGAPQQAAPVSPPPPMGGTGPTPPGSAAPKKKSKAGLIIAIIVLLLAAAAAAVWFLKPEWIQKTVFDQTALEEGVTSILTNSPDADPAGYGLSGISDVRCPDGQQVEVEAVFVCHIDHDGDAKTVVVTVMDAEGLYQVGAPQ